MNFRKRKGFTLVELLVVITIIGMLMALLLPAVQSAREAGRRATCMNNQKNITLAFLNFESARGKFPGYVNYLGQTSTSVPANWVPNDVSWAVMLTPYLEREDLWKKWSDKNVTSNSANENNWDPKNPNVVRPQLTLKTLICPSDISVNTPFSRTPLSYAVNCGVSNEWLANDSTVSSVTEGPEHGVFHYRGSDPTLQGPEVSLDYLSNADGSSHTLLLSDNTAATNWVPRTGTTPSAPGLRRIPPEEFDVGILYNAQVNSNDSSALIAADGPGLCANTDYRPVGINDCKFEIREDGNYQAMLDSTGNLYPEFVRFARPSSNHPGGMVVVSFGDGHQQVMSDTIEYRVFQHIMTPLSEKAGIWGIFDPAAL